jgi:hypothetical protein
MEQRHTWEAYSHLAGQEIIRLLRKQNIHDRVHKNQLLVRNLSQMNSIHNFPPCIFNILQVPNLMTIFHWFGPTRESVQVWNIYQTDFCGEE